MTQPTAPSDTRPSVPILHHLARTGGTIISKCLAVMPGVVLLSEIHPMGLHEIHPLKQAHEWHNLLTKEDLKDLHAGKKMSFAEAIGLVRQRAAERGKTLVIRDWNHLDFMGVPFIPEPTGRLLTHELLAQAFRTPQFTTVRHPIDQWLSLSGLGKDQAPSLEKFLEGCAAFAEHAVRIGFVRYEDFTRDPDAALKVICEHLEIPFDPAYRDRWSAYTKITGDVGGSRGGVSKISPVARAPVSAQLLGQFERVPAYRRTLELLGYEHPAASPAAVPTPHVAGARAPLPTMLVTDTIRSAVRGQSHGGVHLVDLEKGTHRKVLDWNSPDINWEGRGGDRGLRGVAFHAGEIYMVASNELFVFDQNFAIKRSFRNRFLSFAHEVFLSEGILYISSTGFDSILAFDIAKGQFTKGWMFRMAPEAGGGPPGAKRPNVLTGVFDPRTDKGPTAGDTVHLNQVWRENGLLYFSGVRFRAMLHFDAKNAVKPYAVIPEWTHNARPYKGGVLANSTKSDTIVHTDRSGNVLTSYAIPRYPEGELLNVPATEDVARQAFGRGLVTTPDGLIIGASSPTTVTAYDGASAQVIKSINITMDVRNAPHGLAIWPF